MDKQPPRYTLASWLFLKALGIIYFIAFLSLALQVRGLIGSNGILPIEEFLHAVGQQAGWRSWLEVPTLFWLDASDWMLITVPIVGAILSVFLFLGIARRVMAGLLFVFYLSLVAAGQAFLSFQWDFLLLEAGFLAIFLTGERSRVWLLQWLLFRLMFLSGVVKLTSGDPTWRNLTALQYHYWSQPLPTPLAWYMSRLPDWFQTVSCVFVFAVELVLPFLIFAPRGFRYVAAAGFTVLQGLILLTGNYAFFNWLALALVVLLLDDGLLGRAAPQSLSARADLVFPVVTPNRLSRVGTAVLLSVVLLLSGLEIIQTFTRRLPAPAEAVLRWTAPFGIVNTYGLFAMMTTLRPEIIVEGSNDGETWTEYRFKYKPDDLRRGPSWVAPYQPRLDWQMWFAALGNYRDNPWFVNFMACLLRGSPPVTGLMRNNPFPKSPPTYVRALVYEYKFADPRTHRRQSLWWEREPKVTYFPAVGLRR